MAGSIKGITIEIGGETTGLQNALKDVNRQSNELQRELKGVDRLLQLNPGNVELLAQKQQLLTERISATSDKLNTLRVAQAQVESQFQNGQIGIEQYRAFQRELITTEGSLNGLRNQLQNMETEQQQVAKSTRALNTMFDATGTSVDQFANALGSRLTESIRSGTATSSQLEEAIERIGREALGSEADLNRLREALRSADDGANLDEIRRDLEQIRNEAGESENAVRGFGKELTGVIGGLAAAGGLAGAISTALDTSSLDTKIEISMEVPESSKASVKEALNVVKSYGVDGEAALEGIRRQWALNKDASDESNARVVQYAGVVATAFEGIDFTELIQESNEVGSALKLSNEDAIALINSLLKAGFPPEQLDTISEYGTQMKEAGFSTAEIQNIFEKGIDLKSWNIDNLNDGVKEARLQMAGFGAEVPKALKPLISESGISVEKFNKWGEAVAKGGKKGSKAMSEVATWLDGIKDKTLKNELATAVYGTKWEDQGDNMIAVFQGLDEAVDKTDENMSKMTKAEEALNSDPVVAMREAFGSLVLALGPLLTAISGIIGKIAEWVKNNTTLATVIAAVGAGIGILMGLIIALAPVFTALATAAGFVTLSLGAIIGIAAGVVVGIGLLIAAIVAVVKNWDAISAATISIWGSIKDFLISCWEGIKSSAIASWDGITSFFKTWGTTILAVITGPIGILVGLIVKNWDTIKATTQTVWNGIKTFLSNLWNGIKSTASTVWNGIKTYFSTVLNAYKTSFTTIWNGIKTVVTNVWNGLKTTATTVWNSIKTYFTTVLNAYKTLFTTIWNAIKTVTTTVFNAIKTTITTVWNSIKSTTSSVLNGIKSTVSTIWNGIKSVISSVLNGIKTVVSNVWNGIKSTVASVMNGIKSAIQSGWNTAKNTVTTSVNGIKTVVSNIFNSLKSVISTAMSGVKTAIQTGWNAAKSFLDGISLTSVGKNIVSGLVSGISSMFGKVKSKISELASLIPAWAKDILDIHSPSRVMKAIGVHIGDGLAEGIDSSKSAVAKSAVNLAKAAVPDFSSNIAITQSELKKLNSVITSVTNTTEKEINKIQSNAQKERALILKAANKSIGELVKQDKEKIKTINKNEEDKINEIIAKAKDKKRKLTAAEERKITAIHEDAKEARAKVAKNEASKVASISEKATKDRTKVATNAQKEITAIEKGLNAEKLKSLEEYVDKRKGLASMTTEQEVEFWKEAVKKFKKGTEEKTQAQIKYNKALDTLNKEQFDKEKDYIEDKKYYNKLSLSEELAAYQQYLKEHKKGSEERIYYEKEIYRVKQEIQKQIDQINEDYLSKVQTLNQSLIEEENKLNEEYKKALDDRAKSLYSFAGIFDEIAEKDVSGDTLLNNLAAQVTAFEDWQRNISELASKGINDGLLAELQEMGPKAGAEIAALNTLTDEQLQQYVALWQEKNRLATEQATKELEGMKIETGIKIEELKKDTAAKLLGYQEEWRKAMVDAKLQVKNEAKEMPGIGEFAVAGLIDGLNSKKSALVSAAQELASIVKDTFQTALDIHSPSRVFKGFGVNINEGLIQGIQESSRQLDRAMNDVYGSMASSAGKMLQTSGSSQRTNSYDHSKTMHNTFQINTVDSTDIVRKIERAQRRMAFEFGV